MHYDSILLELMSRIQTLEQEVMTLKVMISAQNTTKNRVTTEEIRGWIDNLKKQAVEQGKTSLTLRASEVHKELHLKSRYPMVCNAMRQCMEAQDEILHETASGYSSSLEILYHLKQ